LIRRADHPDDPWSGHWALPSGGIEDADQGDARATAAREAWEETAVRVDALSGRTLAQAEAGAAVGRSLQVAPVIWYEAQQKPTTPCAREVAATKWLPLTDIPVTAADLPRAALSSVTKHTFPYLDIDGGPLWGFTLRLLQRCHAEGLLRDPFAPGQ
jgi:8-oxo-dGTP pyrophosphatase MutT (NUDIX family)